MKPRNFVINNYSKESDLLFFSIVDEQIIELADLLNLKKELLENTKDNTDFFTFKSVIDNKDIDLYIFLYIGKRNNSGFLSFYFPKILSNKSNILPILKLVNQHQPYLEIEILGSAISEEVLNNIKMNINDKKYVAVFSPSELYFDEKKK